MVSRAVELPYSVVEAARRRIINAFSNGVPVYLSMSGGKDSIVLAHLTHTLIREGRIDPAQLIVDFIDEEAIFGEVERLVRHWRRVFLDDGAQFRWYCIEVRHFNCFNQLTNDESFICWDSTKRDVWCRPMPSFAITDHPMLRRRVDTYQDFLHRVERGGISMGGLRTAESMQRALAFRQKFENAQVRLLAPLYDWRDTDVWRYIRDEELDFPETYLHLYQTGSSARQMRISQFFSIDTARSLVKMQEYEPGLMQKITAREPNAYLAALYWDTEMFRSSGGSGEAGSSSSSPASPSSPDGEGEEAPAGRDWKAATMQRLESAQQKSTAEGLRLRRLVRSWIVRRGQYMEERDWRTAYNILVGGDPKNRTLRALISSVAKNQGEAL